MSAFLLFNFDFDFFTAKVIESANYSHHFILSCSFAGNLFFMRKGLLVVLLIVVAVAVYWFKFRKTDEPEQPKQQPIQSSLHSDIFNKSVDGLMASYFEIKDAFVDADSAKVKTAVAKFIAAADSVKLEEFKKDSGAIYQSVMAQLGDIKANAESIIHQHDITEMRKDFWNVSENIYPMLKSIHYEGKTLYWQNCPMAFGEDKGANWISNSEEVVNPYLGKNHPTYKATMLHCGEVKDSIKAQ